MAISHFFQLDRSAALKADAPVVLLPTCLTCCSRGVLGGDYYNTGTPTGLLQGLRQVIAAPFLTCRVTAIRMVPAVFCWMQIGVA
jgi:hypothetical protein